MRLLLDTHVFLWYISADIRLPLNVREVIRDPENEAFLSVVSVWEAVIKHSLGKLSLPGAPAAYLPQQRIAHSIASLVVEEPALLHLASLPPLHRDPFDRLLVAQALQHELTLVTLDEALRAYSAPCFPFS
jgi:PIN domain nuclease of toxin-antitoxin system